MRFLTVKLALRVVSALPARSNDRHSSEWVLRLGDGTEESHARMQAALDLGADQGVNYRSQDFVAEVARITGPTNMGDDGTAVTTDQYPFRLTAAAPTTPPRPPGKGSRAGEWATRRRSP